MLDQGFGHQDGLVELRLSGSQSRTLEVVDFKDSIVQPKPEIIFDISRLISRIRYSAPTGVDRVEMAYAIQLLQLAPERLSFAAVHPSGVYGRLPTAAVVSFLIETLKIWSENGSLESNAAWIFRRFALLLRLFPRLIDEAIPDRMRARVYLQVSPHHLDRPDRVKNILMRERARFICLVHDLIPIEYPEHARPNGKELHARRMDTVSLLADAVIAASQSTRRSFLNYAGRAGKSIKVVVSPLGAEPIISQPLPKLNDLPYFVSVGTIEPRKNHLLLLNIWRRMVEELGPRAIPRLVLIGRRGWENENIVDMLDRCPALKGVVEERGHLSDRDMWSLVRGARALLMPSFAEGFGLPIIEALSLGVPVLCSDIAAHREIADPVAEFLDPLDGPGWRRAVLDYAAPGSVRSQDQIRRMAHWRAPTWKDHVQSALDLVDETV